SCNKVRLEQIVFALMRQQVSMVAHVSRQELAEDDFQDACHLGGVSEGRDLLRFQAIELPEQGFVQTSMGRAWVLTGEKGKSVAYLLLKAGIGLAAREVQVAEHPLQGNAGIEFNEKRFHRRASSVRKPYG